MRMAVFSGKLIEYRIGVFARAGDTCVRNGKTWVFTENFGWCLKGQYGSPFVVPHSQDSVPPDLRPYFPKVFKRSGRGRPRGGWGNGVLEGLE